MNRDRAKLIRRLLYEKVKIENHEYDYPEEFARNWANIWTVWLMTRSANPVYQEQMRVFLEELFAKNGSHKEMVEKILTASGPNNDNGAVNYILRHMGEVIQEGDGPNKEEVSTPSRSRRARHGCSSACRRSACSATTILSIPDGSSRTSGA